MHENFDMNTTIKQGNKENTDNDTKQVNHEDKIPFSESKSEAAVIATMENLPLGSRNRVVAESLIKHLHGFIKDIEPSNEEWEDAMKFLVKLGQWSSCPEKRHELMLVSDTLGVTMLVDCINHRLNNPNATEWTVQGPFHGNHKYYPNGTNICLDGSDKIGGVGVPALISGRVLDCETLKPIHNAKVDVWLTGVDGEYAIQKPNANYNSLENLCGVFKTDENGEFNFKAIKPTVYKVPEDGPGGDLLRFCGRHPWRPAHVHFMITADNYEKVTTHLFVKDDPYLLEDAVFAVLESLIIEWPMYEEKEEAAELGFEKTPYTKVSYDFKLSPKCSLRVNSPEGHKRISQNKAQNIKSKSEAITRIFRFSRKEDGTICYGTLSENTTGSDFSRLEVIDASPIDTPMSLIKRTGIIANVSEILAPIENVPNVYCVGINYLKHYEEGAKKRGVPLPKEPMVFMKPTTSICGPFDEIMRPPSFFKDVTAVEHADESTNDQEQLDYEGELVIVIGHREAKNLGSAKEAMNYVLGVTVGNDITNRFWQRRNHGSWGFGKGFDGFCPIGPCITTIQGLKDSYDEKTGVLDIILKTELNGNLMQHTSTNDFIFSIGEIVQHLSHSRTLLPGTIIMTGTPNGVGYAKKPEPIWLKPGDTLKTTLEGCGSINNNIV